MRTYEELRLVAALQNIARSKATPRYSRSGDRSVKSRFCAAIPASRAMHGTIRITMQDRHVLWNHTLCCTRAQHPRSSPLLHKFQMKVDKKQYRFGCSQNQDLRLRRYRDAWNRAVTRRLSRVHNHSLKIKARTCLWFWVGLGD